MRKLHAWITKIEPPKWVMAILVLIIILRIPSLLEPYYYGDEMIYLTLGNAIRHGLTLYSQIHDNKPPLLYLVGAIAGNLFWFKAILMFWMLATTIAFWHLCEKLFNKDGLSQKIAVTAFAALTTLPLLEGNIANAELFLIGPIIIALFLLLERDSAKNTILAGLLFSIAVLFKVPAIFDAPVIFLYWLITSKNFKDIKTIFVKGIIFSLAFLTPIAITFLWYFLHGALTDYIKAAFLQNIGYLSSWQGKPQASFVVRNGPLMIRAGIVVIGIIALRIFSSKLSKTFLLATLWLLTSLFAVTLSSRPYPHYLIQVVPSISLLIAILVSSKKFEQVLTVMPFTLLGFTIFYYHFWYYSTSTYYQKFISWQTHQISKDDYFNKFNPQTTNNYSLATKIQTLTSKDEKIFVWGEDAPVIYALSRRLPSIKYTADYHITDFSTLKDTANALKMNPPSLMIFLSHAPKFDEIQNLLNTKYVRITGTEAEIWHLLKS